jgi:hypothetical protein
MMSFLDGFSDRRRISMRLGVLSVAIVALALLVGCGSAAHSGTPEETQPSEQREAVTTAPANVEEAEPEPGGPVAYVGTITGTDGEGAVFRDSYRIGPFFYNQKATPPESVLSACNATTPSIIASSVFARGELSVSYVRGILPLQVGIPPEGIVAGEQFGGVTAYQFNGEWVCRQASIPLAIEFQPGETQTFPIWVLAEFARSNAQPRVGPSTFDNWYFNYIGSPLNGSRTPLRVTGPGTAQCYNWQQLQVYGRSGNCKQ